MISTLLSVASAVLAVILYTRVCYEIYRGKGEYNLASWALWASIEVILTAALIAQQGNYLLVLTFTLGTTISAGFIARFGRSRVIWGKFELLVTLLVLTCLIIWYQSGPKVATIAATIAVFVAGLPQVKEAWEKPQEQSTWVYLGFALANLISVISGKEWSIEERLFSSVSGLYCLLIVMLSLRKLRQLPPDPSPA